MTITELNKPKDLPFNPGEIIEINGWPRWVTSVGPFELSLDIIPVDLQETGEHLGIASFVVMEQDQRFLDYAGSLLAQSITNHLTDGQILLITTETKGSHFTPKVWTNLYNLIGSRLEDRIITLRKGSLKVYMKRPVFVDGQEINLPQVMYRSITSIEEQTLTPSPIDLEYLVKAVKTGIKPVIVDDFVGQGGTTVAICKILEELGFKQPEIAAVIGLDGNLYKKTFTNEGINIKLLPKPFPLRLPTFKRENPQKPWQINI